MASVQSETIPDEQDMDETRTSVRPQSSDRTRFDFVKNWFEWVRPEWEERTHSLREKKLRVLKIGTFEGSSTTWILDNLMSHPESTMITIDTFAGSMEHHDTSNGVDSHEVTALEARFLSNVAKCETSNKLTVMKMHSDNALLTLRRERREFDFIYIDASHVAVDVLHDAVLCWRMLSPFGIMVFNDISYKGYMEDCFNPRIAIEVFLKCVEPRVEYEETAMQMWARRVPSKFAPTANPDPSMYDWERGLAKKP